jgi:hypothetical protein
MTRYPSWRITAVASLAAVALALVTVPGSQASTTSPGNVLKVWAPEYMARNAPAMTRTLAVAEARHFDVIIAKPTTYSRFVVAMHTANPRLQLFAYVNGMYAAASQGSSFPASWYEYDASGAKVRSVLFNNYLMDPTSSGWMGDRAKLCQQVIARSGYDGCGLDTLGSAAVSNTGYVTGFPINKATNKPWTMNQWLQATTRVAAAVRSATAPHPLAGNGIGDGQSYFASTAPTSQLFGGVDVGMAEGFLRVGRAPLFPYPSAAAWKQNVDMLADAGSRAHRLVVVTKVWNTGTQVEKDAWHKYALASFLLGSTGTSYFSFLYDIGLDPATYQPWWNTQLRAPSGSYFLRQTGVYERDFAAGIALVNPTGRSRTVSLGGAYTTLDGRTVSSLTLAPTTGEVLTRS